MSMLRKPGDKFPLRQSSLSLFIGKLILAFEYRAILGITNTEKNFELFSSSVEIGQTFQESVQI